MTVLFIVTSFWAYGEVSIACEFAVRVKAAGFEPMFLIPASHEKIIKRHGFRYTTLMPRLGKVNRIIMKDLEERYHPSPVILADFLNYNFCENHYGLTYDDLSIFSGRLGTFDDFDWVLTGQKMDTYGFKAQKFGEIDIRKYGFGLCPCPIVNPGRKQANTYYYPLISKSLPYDRKKTEIWKRKLGLPVEKPLILFTSATWQEIYKQYPEVIAFVEAANEVFAFCLEELSRQYQVIYIGPEGYFTSRKSKSVTHLQQLAPEVFEEYLLATDVFLSRNITSTALARLALSGIPAVNLKNSVFFKDKSLDLQALPFTPLDWVAGKLAELELCYPYRMFPVGWYNFLSPVIKGNPYLKTIKQAEQFDVNGILNTVHDLVENETALQHLAEQRSRYLQMLEELPSVGEIIRQLV
jgi:hypothetical protein